MANVALSAALLAVAGVQVANAAETINWAPTPLINQVFPKPTDAPYQVYPYDPNAQQVMARGGQSGFNMCNSTTETQDSMCQTSFVNGLDDFCLWAPPKLDMIANTEGEEVAWCTKKGHGTRVIPEGTIKGAQLLKTKDYWMITGLLDQPRLNIPADDFGGELDSGGQDGQGNPIGGLLYSSAFAGDASQITWWTEFVGSGQFCIKICNPQGDNNPGYCQHTLDRIGLAYNCPSKYTLGAGTEAGDFEICDSDNMVVPGVYTDAAGATQSYAQPPESAGPITTVPYTPTSAASSNCVKMTSSALFADAPAFTGAVATTSGAAGSSATNGPAANKGANPAATTTKGADAAKTTGGATQGNGAATVGFSVVSLVASVFAAAFFA